MLAPRILVRESRDHTLDPAPPAQIAAICTATGAGSGFSQFHTSQFFKLIAYLIELSQYRVEHFVSERQLASLACSLNYVVNEPLQGALPESRNV
jgi:hypothetical protein